MSDLGQWLFQKEQETISKLLDQRMPRRGTVLAISGSQVTVTDPLTGGNESQLLDVVGGMPELGDKVIILPLQSGNRVAMKVGASSGLDPRIWQAGQSWGLGELIALHPAEQAVAMGYNASAEGSGAVAIGGTTDANQAATIAIGYGAMALTGTYSTAIGYIAGTEGNDATALGGGALASGDMTIAVGRGAWADGAYNMAMGVNAYSSAGGSMALGNGANAYGLRSLAIGESAEAAAGYGIAIGWNAKAWGIGSMVFGNSIEEATNYNGKVGVSNWVIERPAAAGVGDSGIYIMDTGGVFRRMAIGDNALKLDNGGPGVRYNAIATSGSNWSWRGAPVVDTGNFMGSVIGGSTLLWRSSMSVSAGGYTWYFGYSAIHGWGWSISDAFTLT